MTLPGNTVYRKTRYEFGESRILQVLPLLGLLGYIVGMLLAAMVVTAPKAPAHEAIEFRVYDRPLLETVQAVYKARRTGVAEFNFNGVHYVVTNIPKEYVEYSSWWNRMP